MKCIVLEKKKREIETKHCYFKLVLICLSGQNKQVRIQNSSEKICAEV